MKKIVLIFLLNILIYFVAGAQVKNDNFYDESVQKCKKGDLITLTNDVYNSFLLYLYGNCNTDGRNPIIFLRDNSLKINQLKVVTKENLRILYAEQIKSIEISYEPLKNVALFGTSGNVCVITITLK